MPFKSSNLIRDYNYLYAKIYDKEKFIQAWDKWNLVPFWIDFAKDK
jgi:hypothetical protein